MANKNVIYCPIIGRFDTLHDPEIITPGWDYICFTDDKDLKSNTWDIRLIKKDPNLSNAQMAKKIIIMYHHYVPDYDLSILVPGYNVIKVNLDYFVNKYFSKKDNLTYDMLVLKHPKNRRKCCYRVANFVANRTKDPKAKKAILDQRAYYFKKGMPICIPSHPTGITIRRKGNKNLEKHCELWWNEILKHSTRDQLSLGYILWKYNLIKCKSIDYKNFNVFFQGNEIHNEI